MLRKYGVGLLILLLNVSVALAATTFQRLILGTTTTILTITNLASGSRTASGTTYDPRQGQTGQGYMTAVIECVFTFAAAPTAGTSVPIWFLGSGDGTNFENATTARLPNVSCPVTPAQAGTLVRFEDIRLPSSRFRAVALNDGTGQQLNSGTITITPTTIQGN